MNTEKKLIIKRLVIFCVLAFAPMIIATPILCQIVGGPLFSEENAVSPVTALYAMLGMCTPMLANFLTRIITKEGLDDPYLSLSFRNGKGKYYLLSILVPLAYSLVSAVLMVLIFLRGYAADEIFEPDSFVIAPFLIISQLTSNLTVLIAYFGEEYGWRGYLGPKLSQLMSEPAAIVTGGIIWGLWHAPLTCVGHNFGFDYPLFPFLGILMMCLSCVIMNAFLTLITKHTGSVIPASLAHMTHNSAGASIMLAAVMKEVAYKAIDGADPVLLSLVLNIPLAVTAVISMILLMRNKKNQAEKTV